MLYGVLGIVVASVRRPSSVICLSVTDVLWLNVRSKGKKLH